MPENLHAWEVSDGGRTFTCLRCFRTIPAAAVLVHPDTAAGMRERAPDRLIWEEPLQGRDEITVIDARDLVRWSGQPPCTPHLELESP